MQKTSENFEGFTGLYSDNKTFCYSLIPVLETVKNMELNNVIDMGGLRHDNLPIMRTVIDRCLGDEIGKILSDAKASKEGWPLTSFYEAMTDPVLFSRKAEDQKARAKAYQKCERIKKEMYKKFEKIANDEIKERGFVKGQDKNIYDAAIAKATDKEKEIIAKYYPVSGYARDIIEIRKNIIFNTESKFGTVAYRCIDDNMIRYMENIQVLTAAKDYLEDDLDELQKEIGDSIGMDVRGIFDPDYYTEAMTPEGIDKYNAIINGYTVEDKKNPTGNKKILGLNERINIKRQRTGARISQVKPLYKQILIGEKTFSLSVGAFESDDQVKEAVDEMVSVFHESITSEFQGYSLKHFADNIFNRDIKGVYINTNNAVNKVSNKVFGFHGKIESFMREEYDRAHEGQKKSKAYNTTREKWVKGFKFLSIWDIDEYATKSIGRNIDVMTYYDEVLRNAYQNFLVREEEYIRLVEDADGIRQDGKKRVAVENVLKAMKYIQKIFCDFRLSNDVHVQKDEEFYAEHAFIEDLLSPLSMVFDNTRNYAEKKPYSREKINVDFLDPTPLAGWADGGTTNMGTIFRKDGKYYLAVANKNTRKSKKMMRTGTAVADGEEYYERMIYTTLDCSKQFPRLFITTGLKKGESLVDQLGIQGEERKVLIDKELRKLPENKNIVIDYYKRAMEVYNNGKYAGILDTLRPTEEYTSCNEFIDDCTERVKSIEFEKFSADYIRQLVRDGYIYLFEITDKDMDKEDISRMGLPSIIFKSIFSEENYKTGVPAYWLQGGAQVFYRKASLNPDKQAKHRVNVPTRNKTTGEITMVPTEIMKDRRFAYDRFMLHVPVKINANSSGDKNRVEIDSLAEDYIKGNKDVNIVAVNRGENNLLYAVVINQKGEIIEQKSLNVIESVSPTGKVFKTDYNEKLEALADKNRKAREEWDKTGTIKELKNGYLSQALYVLTQLMLKYNAVLVMENLSGNFKRSRQKVEKNIYQRFETMLQTKLEHYIPYKEISDRAGSVFNAYQLTGKGSLDRFGQNGLVFALNPSYITKIDPTTGFFGAPFAQYSNMNGAKDFIKENLHAIRYNDAEGYYEFDITDHDGKDWTVCSHGKRVDVTRTEDNKSTKHEWVDPTAVMEELLKEYEFDEHSKDIKKDILDRTDLNADFYKRMFHAYNLVTKMENKYPGTENQIISPVKNDKGMFFKTGLKGMPENADANAAFNLARKMLIVMDRINNQEVDEDTGDKKPVSKAISNEAWKEFAIAHKDDVLRLM